jgi:hypothetical protein
MLSKGNKIQILLHLVSLLKLNKTMKVTVRLFRCVLLAAAWLAVSTNASNPYSSNVVALTRMNWKELVTENPHPVLVNMCRFG